MMITLRRNIWNLPRLTSLKYKPFFEGIQSILDALFFIVLIKNEL